MVKRYLKPFKLYGFSNHLVRFVTSHDNQPHDHSHCPVTEIMRDSSPRVMDAQKNERMILTRLVIKNTSIIRSVRHHDDCAGDHHQLIFINRLNINDCLLFFFESRNLFYSIFSFFRVVCCSSSCLLIKFHSSSHHSGSSHVLVLSQSSHIQLKTTHNNNARHHHHTMMIASLSSSLTDGYVFIILMLRFSSFPHPPLLPSHN